MSAAANPYESQARLWVVAFVASALVNLVGLSVIAVWVLAKIALHTPPRDPVATSSSVATIIPEMIERAAPSPPPPAPAVEPAPAQPAAPPPPPSQFARTSVDQEEVAPERPDFMGERNTRATSDDTPVTGAQEQIAQKGRDTLYEDELETTRSHYQDGDLAHDRIKRDATKEPEMPSPLSTPAPPTPPAPTPAEPSPATTAETTPKHEGTTTEPQPETPPTEETRERLADGPLPVERRVKEAKPEDETKKAVEERKSEGQQAQQQQAQQQPKPATNPNAPGFRGNQSKTRLVGSISRSGRSALNVEDSVLGRYHAAVSRAVEKEWQLNCVRNRDYITPGMLTMSFMLDAKGKVKEIRVVEALQVGAIPKGFTLNAINHAEIPAMPADLKKQLDGEPLELLYRFSF
ncbi:hypothetical protein [Luteolibacter soli]|uniref:TonB C-terminal domain-containing protein n=1 Tax=Luteolibacter soli TaxID=3135280 RepID=A0ABU9AV64_9BACT